VHAADSESAQEYTPFEGFELTAAVTDTYLRGEAIYTGGTVVGSPRGAYVRRPSAR
jgi:allantoinase